MTWFCSACTVANESEEFLCCDICGTERSPNDTAAAAVPSPPASSAAAVAVAPPAAAPAPAPPAAAVAPMLGARGASSSQRSSGGGDDAGGGGATASGVVATTISCGGGASSSKVAAAAANTEGLFPPYAFPVNWQTAQGASGSSTKKRHFTQVLNPPAATLRYHASDAGALFYDGFPKARQHLLGFALPGSALAQVEKVDQLTRGHLDELRRLHALCCAAAESLARDAAPRLRFRVGYHVTPSLAPLHCHVISCDLVSDKLKTKAHFRSFSSRGFVDARDVESWLELCILQKSLKNRIQVHDDDGGGGLACHRCRTACATMPALNKHLAECEAPFDQTWDLLPRLKDSAESPAKRRRADPADAPPPPPPPLAQPSSSPPPLPTRDRWVHGVELRSPWLASSDGCLVMARFNGAAALNPTHVAGFDFDGTLSDRRHFSCGDTHYPQFEHCARVLRRLHADGAAVFVATNESITHSKAGSAEVKRQLGDKLRRLEAFAASLGSETPLLVMVATSKYRGDCHKGKAEPVGMWRAAAAVLGLAAPPAGSFYVGNAAGRPWDHGEDDVRFARAARLAFHTEDVFFERLHPVDNYPR